MNSHEEAQKTQKEFEGNFLRLLLLFAAIIFYEQS